VWWVGGAQETHEVEVSALKQTLGEVLQARADALQSLASFEHDQQVMWVMVMVMMMMAMMAMMVPGDDSWHASD
jgi:hypothetical protein